MMFAGWRSLRLRLARSKPLRLSVLVVVFFATGCTPATRTVVVMATATSGATAQPTLAPSTASTTRPPASAVADASIDWQAIQPAKGYRVAKGFIVDGEHGRIYARSGRITNTGYPDPALDADLMVIDQETLDLLSAHPARGLLAVDAPNRRVYIDDVSRGLQVLGADTLAELRFIELAPPPDVESEWPPTPAPIPPLADATSGAVIVGRGSRLLVLDPKTGEIVRSIGDEVGDEVGGGGWIEKALIDASGARIHLTRRLGGRDCYLHLMAVESYELGTGRLLDRQTACHLDIVSAWDGQVLASEHEGRQGPGHVRRMRDGRLLAQASGGPLPGGIQDPRRGRLFETIGEDWPGPALLYWFDDQDLSPMGWIELPEAAVATSFDPVHDLLYLYRNGSIVALPAAEIRPKPPLESLPTTRLTRPPGSFHIQTDDMTEMTYAIARGLTNARSRGACMRDVDAWGWVYHTSDDPIWRVVDAALPCQLDDGPRFHPSPSFPSDGRALVSTGASSGDGLHRTLDGGLSWQAAMVGLENRAVLDVVFSPDLEDDDTAFVTTNDGRAWRSRDFAATWQPIGNFTGLTASRSPDGNRVYAIASHSNAVHASSDAGVTWNQLGSMPDADGDMETRKLRVLANPEGRPPVLLALAFAAEDEYDFPWPIGECQMYRSVDGGQSWAAVGPRIAEYVDIERALAGPFGVGAKKTWLLERSRRHEGPSPSRFLRSDDDGATWYPADLPPKLHSAALAAAPDGRLIVAKAADDFSELSLADLVSGPR